MGTLKKGERSSLFRVLARTWLGSPLIRASVRASNHLSSLSLLRAPPPRCGPSPVAPWGPGPIFCILVCGFWWVRYEGSASAAWEKRLPRQPERHTAYPHSDGQWRSSRRADPIHVYKVYLSVVVGARVGVEPWTERVAGGRAAHRRNPVKVFHRSIRAQGRAGTVPQKETTWLRHKLL